MTILFCCCCNSSACSLSPLFYFSLPVSTGSRGHTKITGNHCYSQPPSVHGNGKFPLSGYFDLTQTDCRPSRIASMTCPGLWLPVRQTLSRFSISRADPDRHRQPAPKRNLQFITCLTATGSYRIYTCFPEQIILIIVLCTGLVNMIQG